MKSNVNSHSTRVVTFSADGLGIMLWESPIHALFSASWSVVIGKEITHVMAVTLGPLFSCPYRASDRNSGLWKPVPDRLCCDEIMNKVLVKLNITYNSSTA